MLNLRKVMIIACFIILTVSCRESPFDDTVLLKFYQILGCREVQDFDSFRPRRFECPDEKSYSDDKCYYKGRAHYVGEQMASDILPKCITSCICEQFLSSAHFTCSHVTCPDLFRNHVDLTCVQQYDSLNDCCSSRQICDPITIGQMTNCMLEGAEYHPGERIFPDSDRCYKCMCAPGFYNQTSFAQNPHCTEMDCKTELYMWDEIRTGCVPVYNKITMPCCPYELICPGYSDTIDRSFASPYSNDERYSCKFGDLTLQHGQKLRRTDNKCLECECSTPPFITCIKTNKC